MTKRLMGLGVAALVLLGVAVAHGGLTAYWSFDSDYSSAVNNATMAGTPKGNVDITHVPGEFRLGGGALKIDSATSGAHNVHISNPIANAASNPTITMVGWYNFTDIAGDGSDARNFIWESHANYSVSFALRNASGVLDAEWWHAASTGDISDQTGPVITPGQWNHVAMVWNSDTRRIKFYHNGQLRDFVVIPTGVLLKEMTGLYIGDYRNGDGGRNFDGYLDEIAVFDHEPSPEVIAGLASGAYTPATAPADVAPALGMRILDPKWVLTSTIAFDNPSGLAVNPSDGKLYAGRRSTTAEGGGVYRIEGDGSAVLVGPGDRPAAIAVDPDNGNFFFSEDNGGSVFRIAAGSGVSMPWVADWRDGDDDPVGLAIVPAAFDGGAGSLVHAGDALSVDRGNGGFEEIWIWSPDTSDVASGGLIKRCLHADGDMADGVGSPLRDPCAIVVAGSRIFVADTAGDLLYEVSPVDGSLTALATSAPIVGPVGLAVDPTSGDLFVLVDPADAPAKVVRVAAATGEVSTVLDTLVDGPGWANLAFSPDGSRLYIGEQGGDMIYELTLVPEPSALVLLAMGGLLACLVSRRRR